MTDPLPIDPHLATRARGALLGLVAGNQLGVPTEHLGTPEAIREAFPHGVWDLPTPPKGSPYDDDAAMTLLLAESLAELAEFDAADVARRWVRWMKLDGRGLGVVELIEVFDVGLHRHQDMAGVHLPDVHESDGQGVLADPGRRNLSGDDAAENTVVHVSLPLRPGSRGTRPDTRAGPRDGVR